jgi:hypothetical protein
MLGQNPDPSCSDNIQAMTNKKGSHCGYLFYRLRFLLAGIYKVICQ